MIILWPLHKVNLYAGAMEDFLMTLQEAFNQGYHEIFSSWERGYISRRSSSDPSEIKVIHAGGSRKGLLFYRKPSWRSTQFCIRQYLKKYDSSLA